MICRDIVRFGYFWHILREKNDRALTNFAWECLWILYYQSNSPGVYLGGRLGAPPPPERFFFGGGGGVPLGFQNLKRKGTVTHHNNRKRYKEEEGKRRIPFLEWWWLYKFIPWIPFSFDQYWPALIMTSKCFFVNFSNALWGLVIFF